MLRHTSFRFTLEKREKGYSPTIAPDLVHWESQSVTREESDTGQRYIHHAQRGSHVMLFVRPSNKDAWGRTPAFTPQGSGAKWKWGQATVVGDPPQTTLKTILRPFRIATFGPGREDRLLPELVTPARLALDP